MNKNIEQSDPFQREMTAIKTSTNIGTISAAENIREVIQAYYPRKARASDQQAIYIGATVMPKDWLDQSFPDSSLDGLSVFMKMNEDGDILDFNRPVLALYSIDDLGFGLKFNKIQNPLYLGQPLSTVSEMEFRAVFESMNFSNPSAPPASAMGAGSAVSATAASVAIEEVSAAVPVAPVVTADSERLDYIQRMIVNMVKDQLSDFADDGLTYEDLQSGVRLALSTLISRYQGGFTPDGQAMHFALDLGNELAQEICLAIAVQAEHPNVTRLAGEGASAESVISSARIYLERLQAFSFDQLLEYFEMTGLVQPRAAAPARAVATTAAQVSAIAPSAPPYDDEVGADVLAALFSTVATAPPLSSLYEENMGAAAGRVNGDVVSVGLAPTTPPVYVYEPKSSMAVACAPPNHGIHDQEARQVLIAAFVQDFIVSYRAESQQGFFGGFLRNTDFLKALLKEESLMDRFNQIKSHFSEERESTKPTRTATVVQTLLAKDEFAGLVEEVNSSSYK